MQRRSAASSATSTTLAALGYPAVVLQVDAVPAVDTAMNAWNANPGSSALANNAVREISAVVDTFRSTHPDVKNVVLIGPDAAIPFARLDDLTTQANEKGYASTFPAESETAASLAAGKVLSDDPYGDDNPQNFLGRQLYLPDVAVGRLVETPADIEGAVQRFVDYDGELDSSTALTTGYSFLTRQCREHRRRASAGSGNRARRCSTTTLWTKGALTGAFLNGSGGPDQHHVAQRPRVPRRIRARRPAATSSASVTSGRATSAGSSSSASAVTPASP